MKGSFIGPGGACLTTSELVINWHVIEACNFSCRYCYAHWDAKADLKGIFRSESEIEALLRKLFLYFSPNNSTNSLRSRMRWNSVRLNIAGGEPGLLGDRLVWIVRAARAIGFDVSIISNGSKLSPEMVPILAPDLSCLGISVDSVSPRTNRAIGRLDRRGRMLSVNDLSRVVEAYREGNADANIKINTVVNQANVDEDLGVFIARIRPDRWKILKAHQEVVWVILDRFTAEGACR